MSLRYLRSLIQAPSRPRGSLQCKALRRLSTTPHLPPSEPRSGSLLLLAPVLVSGLIGAGVTVFLVLFSDDNKPNTGEHSKRAQLDPSLVSAQRFKLSHRDSDFVKVDGEARTNWSVGEKVDREQLMARYAINPRNTRRDRLPVIGRGAYGRVLSAVSCEDGQNVAMKVVSPQQMSARALAREVDVLRRVRGHDNVIHLLDVLECNGEWYLITELCEGGDLLDRLITNGPYDEETCAAVIYNVASALDHVHRCGFVHCDVKPENLVFVKSGGTKGDTSADNVRLIDFGMTRDLASIEKAGGLLLRTSSSVSESFKGNPMVQPPRVGTVAYWAPEQIHAGNATLERNQREVLLLSDPRACDAWALGVVMYIMLFGCHPFDIKGEGIEKQIAKNIVTSPARFDIHGERISIGADAREIISRLLDPNPQTRMKLDELLRHEFFAAHRIKKLGLTARPKSSQEDGSNPLEASSQLSSNERQRSLERLPSSWKQQGFVPKWTEADVEIVNPKNVPRLAPFRSLNGNQALIQALLLAAVATADEDEEIYRTNESLLRAAFNVLDVDSCGLITQSSVERFTRTMRQGHVESGHDIAQAMERAVSRMHFPAPANMPANEAYITYDEFKALLRANLCMSREFEEGEVVFPQGSLPQGVYLLAKGKAHVEWKPILESTGEPASEASSLSKQSIEDGFAIIPAGSIIGETAIVQGRAQRSATVRILERSHVVFIPKQEFMLAVASSKALHDKIFKLTNEQQARRVFQLFDKVSTGRRVTFHQGDNIFKQYDTADSIYLIRKGQVELTVRGQASNKEGAAQIHVRVGRRTQGDIIGISGSQTYGKRSTSATCLDDVEAIQIDSDDITSLVTKYPILKFYIESQKRWRNEHWQKALSDVECGVSEPQLLPMLGEGVEEDGGKSFEEYQRQLNRSRLQQYRAGEYVFRRGEQSGSMFVIESGRCDVEFTNENGAIMAITQLGPGDHIGEQSLLDRRPHFAFSVRCVTPVELRCLSENQFFRLLGNRGTSNFARVVRIAMRERRHRWIANLLKLAHENDAETNFRTLLPDEQLFRVGQRIERLYFIHRGSFVVTAHDGSVIKTLTAGDTVGWEVFREAGAGAHNASATCISRAIVEEIPKSTIEELIEKHKYVSSELEHAASTIVPDFSGATIVRRRSFRF